jgi:hypothetical protein
MMMFNLFVLNDKNEWIIYQTGLSKTEVMVFCTQLEREGYKIRIELC